MYHRCAHYIRFPRIVSHLLRLIRWLREEPHTELEHQSCRISKLSIYLLSNYPCLKWWMQNMKRHMWQPNSTAGWRYRHQHWHLGTDEELTRRFSSSSLSSSHSHAQMNLYPCGRSSPPSVHNHITSHTAPNPFQLTHALFTFMYELSLVLKTNEICVFSRRRWRRQRGYISWHHISITDNICIPLSTMIAYRIWNIQEF